MGGLEPLNAIVFFEGIGEKANRLCEILEKYRDDDMYMMSATMQVIPQSQQEISYII